MSLKINILFSLLVIAYSCKSYKELYKDKEKIDYPHDGDIEIVTGNFYIIESEESNFEVKLLNHSSKDILIPYSYLKPQIVFDDDSISLKALITPNYAFNNIKFDHINEAKRKEIIENLCAPYIDMDGYEVLKVGASIKFVCSLKNYQGLVEGKIYSAQIKFQLTDRIQRYCPSIWSGTVESEKFNIQIREN